MTREYTVKNNDFSEYDSMPWILDRIDRNGTHYYTDPRCPKCGGAGYIDYYGHVEGGVCFLCGGSGRYGTKIIVRTEEYAKKLEERRMARLRANAAQINAEYFEKMGLSSDGCAYIVLPKAYEIKDKLKAAGATFNRSLGWFFDHPVTEWPVAEITPDTQIGEWDNGDPIHFMERDECGILKVWDEAMLDYYCKELRQKYAYSLLPKTEYFGNVGDKIGMMMYLTHIGQYTTQYSFYSETQYVYTFDDHGGHCFVWKTTKDPVELNVEAKTSMYVKGTIKGHNEYKGRKQTLLTRCKISSV